MKKIKGVFVVLSLYIMLLTIYLLLDPSFWITLPTFLLFGWHIDTIYKHGKEISILDHSPLVIAILIPVVLYSWMFLHISNYLR